MSQVLEVAQLGNPIIRRKAEPVVNPADPQIQALIDDMFYTVAAEKGMGIAAPQVHVSRRIFIMCSHPNERYPQAPLMIPTAVINPQITWASPEIDKNWEGCLTLPGIRGLVPRHRSIEVAYTNRYGQKVETHLEDFPARVFQHELDHLEGRVFIDRVESTTEIMMEKEWQAMMMTTV